jgi:hypothetical protein
MLQVSCANWTENLGVKWFFSLNKYSVLFIVYIHGSTSDVPRVYTLVYLTKFVLCQRCSDEYERRMETSGSPLPHPSPRPDTWVITTPSRLAIPCSSRWLWLQREITWMWIIFRVVYEWILFGSTLSTLPSTTMTEYYTLSTPFAILHLNLWPTINVKYSCSRTNSRSRSRSRLRPEAYSVRQETFRCVDSNRNGF